MYVMAIYNLHVILANFVFQYNQHNTGSVHLLSLEKTKITLSKSEVEKAAITRTLAHMANSSSGLW